MGFLDKLIDKLKTPGVETVKGGLYAPITGNYIKLEEIGDGVFSEGILGPGCGIEPEEERVVAPCNGTVTVVAGQGYAVGLMSDDGAEILIHVGMDTVDMGGAGFSVKVRKGDKVKCGQPLLTFSFDEIKKAGHPATTAFIITNADSLGELVFETGKHFMKTEKFGQIG